MTRSKVDFSSPQQREKFLGECFPVFPRTSDNLARVVGFIGHSALVEEVRSVDSKALRPLHGNQSSLLHSTQVTVWYVENHHDDLYYYELKLDGKLFVVYTDEEPVDILQWQQKQIHKFL